MYTRRFTKYIQDFVQILRLGMVFHVWIYCEMDVRIKYETYRKTSNISRTLVGNKIVDNSNVVGASPIAAAPTTSSFLT